MSSSRWRWVMLCRRGCGWRTDSTGGRRPHRSSSFDPAPRRPLGDELFGQRQPRLRRHVVALDEPVQVRCESLGLGFFGEGQFLVKRWVGDPGVQHRSHRKPQRFARLDRRRHLERLFGDSLTIGRRQQRRSRDGGRCGHRLTVGRPAGRSRARDRSTRCLVAFGFPPRPDQPPPAKSRPPIRPSRCRGTMRA